MSEVIADNPLAQMERHNGSVFSSEYFSATATVGAPPHCLTPPETIKTSPPRLLCMPNGRPMYSPPPGGSPSRRPFRSNFKSVLMSSTESRRGGHGPKQPIPSLPNHDRVRRQSSPSGRHHRPPELASTWFNEQEMAREFAQRSAARRHSEMQSHQHQHHHHYSRHDRPPPLVKRTAMLPPPPAAAAAETMEDVVNVDEDVDLDRMYLDLVAEEYTATVRR